MDCVVCRTNDQVDELPPRERIAVDVHWRVAHAFNTMLPGWPVLIPRRHVTSVADLTYAEAAALGGWHVRLSRALRDVTGCVRTYIPHFAEQEGYAHVHFHVEPRMSDIPHDHRGPAAFKYLTPTPRQTLNEQRRDDPAIGLRASLER